MHSIKCCPRPGDEEEMARKKKIANFGYGRRTHISISTLATAMDSGDSDLPPRDLENIAMGLMATRI
jgi:hypothetical protein